MDSKGEKNFIHYSGISIIKEGLPCDFTVRISTVTFFVTIDFHDLSSLVRRMYKLVERSRHLDAQIAEISKENWVHVSAARKTK